LLEGVGSGSGDFPGGDDSVLLMGKVTRESLYKEGRAGRLNVWVSRAGGNEQNARWNGEKLAKGGGPREADLLGGENAAVHKKNENKTHQYQTLWGLLTAYL